jgi:hypothetical protein
MTLCPKTWIGLIGGCLLSMLAATPLFGQINFSGPQPGDVYREYSRTMPPNSTDSWRVTDPNVNLTLYPQAAPFLPNPAVHLTIGDLQNATRAEAVITLWGGHIGTTGKKIRFNGHSWITIPELGSINGIPSGHSGQCYLSEVNMTLPIPLSDLVQGDNYFEGTNTGQTCYGFQWGQHGWYCMMVRVYYDPAQKAHPTGSITSPTRGAMLGENPTIAASVSANVDRVDFLGSYYGYDTDGDGIFNGYHYDYQPLTASDGSMDIRNHVGTATGAPFQVVWNTQWVPDQTAGGIKLMARIRDNTGVWYCSDEVTSLSLGRTGHAVKLYTPVDMPERAWAHQDLSPVVVHVNIPAEDHISDATAARYYIRTWNGIDPPDPDGKDGTVTRYRRLNSWTDGDYGANHFYSYDIRSVATSQLLQGTNTFSFYTTVLYAHGIEIHWPGPALSVAYTGSTYNSPVPLAPDLAGPATESTNQAVSPILSWHATPGALSYQLQVSSDSNFTAPVVDQSNIADTSKQVGTLSSLTKYYWRVRATGPGGAGSYSATWNFTTQLAAPTLVSPLNTASSVLLPVVLRWQHSPGATAYHVQLSTDSAFSTNLIVNDSTVIDTTRQASGLAFGTVYYWRVKAMGTTGEFSFPWSFTTIVGPAATPTLVSPVNGTQGLAVASIDFSWQSAQWATTYRLQIATDPLFATGIAFDDSTIAVTSRSVTGLHTDMTYYWRVSAKGPGGTGSFSNAWSFETVRTIPLGASLVYPANGASAQPVVGLTFRWNRIATATYYGFQLGTDSTFTTGLFKNDTAEVDTIRTVNGLRESTRYFWRVRGRNSAGWGSFSPPWWMTTVFPIPGQVSLISPAPGALAAGDSAAFSWHMPTPAASRYWFEIALDSLFTSFRSIDSALTDTMKLFRPLMEGQLYYWHVRGWSPGGWGPFSETRTLRVIVSAVGEQRPGVPETFALEQNHPNPFNPSTRIGFSIPRATQARLEVYNMLGQRIATVLDEHMDPGYYTVTFDASTLPSGVYLYRLETSIGTLVRKMILMK